MTLGKVIIAAAWADGNVSAEEIYSLKDLLFRLPNLTANDWASLEIYIESHVGPGERERLVEDLKDALSSQEDKELALSALDELVNADGEVTEDELVVVEEMKAEIQSASVGVIGGLGRMLRGPIQRRSQAVVNAPNREDHLDDFIKNRVYYDVRLRLDESGTEIDINDAELWKLSLAGGLLARVVYEDREVTKDESSFMEDALIEHWQLSREAAEIVVDVAISTLAANMDYFRLSREFFECTTEEERVQFLEALFAVAACDGMVTFEETETIRGIASSLLLTHKQFIDAKLTIPREQRSS